MSLLSAANGEAAEGLYTCHHRALPCQQTVGEDAAAPWAGHGDAMSPEPLGPRSDSSALAERADAHLPIVLHTPSKTTLAADPFWFTFTIHHPNYKILKYAIPEAVLLVSNKLFMLAWELVSSGRSLARTLLPSASMLLLLPSPSWKPDTRKRLRGNLICVQFLLKE